MTFPLETLTGAEAARKQAWLRWRSALDLDKLDYEGQRCLPLLAARLPQWLAGDPDAMRIQGIVKMTWTRNQLRLQLAAELCAALAQASIEPVAITGPLAWTLELREEGAIRPIGVLNLLIRRQHVFLAVKALQSFGWQLASPEPTAATLNWSQRLTFEKGGETLHLCWRLAEALLPEQRAVEQAMLRKLRKLSWRGPQFTVLSAEAGLLERLQNRPAWDPVPWPADVLTMRLETVDWQRFVLLTRQVASSFPVARVGARLAEVNGQGALGIPADVLEQLFVAPVESVEESSRSSWWKGLLWRA
jgi:hypothetical protein